MADKMLFMVAAMAAEMERELIRERTLDGLAAAEAQGRKGLFAVSSGLLRVRWGQGMYTGLGLVRVGRGSLAAVR
jgi:hypothetical protein